jgi:hypothetical protein
MDNALIGPDLSQGSSKVGMGRPLVLCLWLVFLLLSVNALLFLLTTTSPYARADVWRHLDEIIIPFLSGSSDWTVLWSNHHPSPLLHILQIVNLKLLGFRLHFDALLGFFFQILTSFLIVSRMLQSASHDSDSVQRRDHSLFVGTLLVVAILQGFNTLQQYTWPLFATVQYLYFFAVITYLATDRCLRSPTRGNFLLLGISALVLAIANASYGTVFLGAMIGALFLVFLIGRDWLYFRVGLMMLLVWAAYYLTLMLLLPTEPDIPSLDVWTVLQTYLMNPASVFTKLSLALLSGLLDIVSIRERVPASERMLVYVSYVFLLLAIVVFTLYLKRGLYRISMIPLAFILVLLMFGLPALVNRFIWIAGDDWGLIQDRYSTTFKLSAVGVIWGVLLLRRKAGHIGLYGRWIAKVLMMIAILALVIQAVQIAQGWQQIPKINNQKRKDSLAIFHASDRRENSVFLPFRVTGYGGVRGALSYLEANQLNVFHPGYPGTPALAKQVKSRREFDETGRSRTAILAPVPSTIVTNDQHEPVASWSREGRHYNLTNLLQERLLVRLKIRSKRDVKGGFSLYTENDRPSAGIDLLRGRQNLYFSLASGAYLLFEVERGGEVLELELRQ